MRVEEDLVRHAVVSNLLLLPCDDDCRLGRLRVVAQRHVELEDVVGVLGHAIRLAHQKVDQLVGEGVGARAAHHLGGLADGALPTLQEEPECLCVVLEEEPELARSHRVAPLLIVLCDLLVVARAAVRSQGRGEDLHVVVGRSRLKGILRPLRKQEELDGIPAVPGRHAVPRHQQGALRRLGLADDGKRALCLAEVGQEQPHDRVNIVGLFVRRSRLLVGLVNLFGLCVLDEQLWRRDAAHERFRRHPVLGANVDLDRLLGRVALLVEPRRILRLL
mmetsp:Transcript_49354/g.163451  ORF Transcript_49354/g.163451 Transcript_49354/m.163451 type:complete len:276 (-) Transcript_49354:2617-3444(-)